MSARALASVAVLPYPSDVDNWWVALLHHEPRLHVIGRLPFWKPRPDGSPAAQALVVASDAGGCQRGGSILPGFGMRQRCQPGATVERTVGGRAEAAEPWCWLAEQGSPIANVLVEVEGYLSGRRCAAQPSGFGPAPSGRAGQLCGSDRRRRAMTGPSPRPEILTIHPYVAGELDAAGCQPDGEAVVERGRVRCAALRPGGDRRRGRGGLSLSRRRGRASARRRSASAGAWIRERIVCGAGSDDLLYQFCLSYGGPGRDIIMSAHGFSIYEIAGTYAGSRVIKVPERNLTADLDAMLAAVSPATRLVFLANPNNPTGPWCRPRTLPASAPRCRRRCCWCWMRPMPNTSPIRLMTPARSWLTPPTIR